MLSMDLTQISAVEAQIISFWLRFYRAHQQTLNFGNWEVSYTSGSINWMRATSQDEVIAIVNNPTAVDDLLKSPAPRHFILNLSPAPITLPNATTWNGQGEPTAPGTVPTGGLGEV